MRVIDQTRNNTAAEVSVGEQFRVELPENPTTGYRWQLQDAGAPALRMAKDSFEAPASGPGGGGLRSWIFVADHPASTLLRMELRRSWQPQPADTFSVTISAKAQ